MARNSRRNEYIICPLPLIKNLIADGQTLNDIFDCGLVSRALCLQQNLPKAKEQLIIDYFTNEKNVPELLTRPLDNAYRTFYPEKGLESVQDFAKQYAWMLESKINANKDFDYNQHISFWYKCRTIMERCALNRGYLPTLINKSSQWLYPDHTPRHVGVPTFLVNAELAFDLYTQRETMSEERRALWAYYFAILSILGTKKWTTTTSAMIKARLAGANSPKSLDDALKQMTDEQRRIYDKYTSRRLYDKLMRELQDQKSIVEYGANRHTYISTKLSLKQLITVAITRTGAAKAKRLSDEKSKYKAEVLAELNG